MDPALPLNETALSAEQTAAAAPADALAWAIVTMRADPRGGSIVINAGLIAAYQAASSPHSRRAQVRPRRV
jgi:hypothetical protein